MVIKIGDNSWVSRKIINFIVNKLIKKKLNSDVDVLIKDLSIEETDTGFFIDLNAKLCINENDLFDLIRGES